MKRLYFNEEEMEQLKDAELHFYTVTKLRYKRYTPRQMDEKVASIYENAFECTLKKNWSCSKCVYDVYSTVGQKYFETKKMMEENKVVQEESETQLKINELENKVTNLEQKDGKKKDSTRKGRGKRRDA